MRRLVAITIACVLLITGTVWAAPQTSVQEIEREIMCTTCGVPLQVAESPAADAQRRQIRRLVDAGLTKRQVEDRLIEIYGEQVLAVPRDTSLSITAYLLPAALVLLAAGMVAGAARTWRQRRNDGDGDDTSEPLSSEAEARVAADLERYER